MTKDTENGSPPISETPASNLEPEAIDPDASVTRATPFVGRARELAALHAALADACAGRGRLVLLAGEPGIGKTRTAEEVAAHASKRGMQVLWGRCYEGDGAPAFWPWVQLLRSATKRLQDDALRTALGWGGAELVHIVPELHQRLPDLGAAAALDSAQARFRLFENVARFLENLSRRAPLVCIVDDLHGGDRSSLLLMEFVARELRDVSAVLVGTYRHGATLIGHPLTELVVEALRLPGVDALTLSGLSRAEVAELVERMTGVPPPPALVAAVYQQTEGNPLYVGEYVRLLLARYPPSALRDAQALRLLAVPDSVRAVVRQRVTPLSSMCRAALSVAAVIGREFYRDVVEVVVASDAEGAAETSVLAALDEAVTAGIIGEGLERGGRYRFAHAVMRETLYEELGSGQRLQLHRRVGEALEHRRDVEEHLAELAYHFYQTTVETVPARAAAESAKAVTYARRAGDRAMTALAYEEAARLYQLALAAQDHSGGADEEERRTLHADLDKARAASHGALEDREAHPTEVEPAVSTGPAGATSGTTSDAIFRREGDYWTFGYNGRTLRLKDTKGLQYIANLLRHPGQEFLALDLIQGSGAGDQGSEQSVGMPALQSATPMLDAPAKAAYKLRLAELRDELREAEGISDIGRVERARAELEFIGRELAAAVGLGGSDRAGGSAVERARSTVTKAIKAAIDKIRAANPSAGRYLARTIRTGNFCAYVPDPDDTTSWAF